MPKRLDNPPISEMTLWDLYMQALVPKMLERANPIMEDEATIVSRAESVDQSMLAARSKRGL